MPDGQMKNSMPDGRNEKKQILCQTDEMKKKLMTDGRNEKKFDARWKK